ncbi:GCN5 family acetyltransferase [Pseudorhodoplanes sp.]|uniref:GCN5 family acetyltransferase n=1 Tax=Pseudorhodoplanes sp. TaxID=1934341 RepID=UPI002CE79C01|nr:GCN5 family acetyltransferase [Pseudorhodoplanes sp.]HWV44136.1 GCN5 family acetyltransferase [Pseudorhodoplanes sp.]
MIRHATPADRDAVVAMMPRANLSAGFGPEGIMPLDPSPARLVLLFDQHLAHSDACLIVYAPNETPEGFLMAALFAHPFDPRHRIAKDTAWWIEEGCRGRLSIVNGMLDAYEGWARSRSCTYSGMAGMGKDPKVGRIYERRGYVAAETHFLKKL